MTPARQGQSSGHDRRPRGAWGHPAALAGTGDGLSPYRRPRPPQAGEHRLGRAANNRPASAPEPDSPALAVRGRVRLVGGAAGRALAAVQGRALSALLASLAEVEVEGGEEVSP